LTGGGGDRDDLGVDAGEMREYALGKPGAWADQPWEGDHVAKVGQKIFAFLGDATIGVKCGATRDEADEWLARYPDDARPSPYIGRSGWNVLRLDGAIPDDELVEALDTSYDLVVAKLPKRERPDGWTPSG
jgi:predicted DNA-binding protein (MmcQ/YjbR family)